MFNIFVRESADCCKICHPKTTNVPSLFAVCFFLRPQLRDLFKVIMHLSFVSQWVIPWDNSGKCMGTQGGWYSCSIFFPTGEGTCLVLEAIIASKTKQLPEK